MNESHSRILKEELDWFVQSLGAYKMRIADADEGFHKADEGCNPRDIMADCNSVIVFGIYVGTDYYRSIKIEDETDEAHRIMHLFRDWLQFRLADYLRERGNKTIVPRGFLSHETLTASLSYKLAAYEAGLAVYGKSGIVLTPEYGPRVNLGVVLSDVALQSDPKLTEFNPCYKCGVCVDLCPPKAIHGASKPPKGYDRDTCVDFVLRLREKTGDKNFLCGYCYDNCPVGKTSRQGFKLSRYRTLTSLDRRGRDSLLKAVLPI